MVITPSSYFLPSPLFLTRPNGMDYSIVIQVSDTRKLEQTSVRIRLIKHGTIARESNLPQEF
jgi:hypothetical protein